MVLASLTLVWLTAPALRQEPVKPNPFEGEIVKYEEADRKNPPAHGGIVFVGSSSIRLWTTLKEDFPGKNVINRGFGGSQISDSVHFAKRIVTPYKPKMIVFFAGTNDIASGKSPKAALADFMQFVGVVRKELPKVNIAYISITPAPSRWEKIHDIKWANGLIKEYTQRGPNLQFVDVFSQFLDAKGGPRPELFVSDQLHMNPFGYAIWKKAVAPILP
jgi:lysophospholipase L1-like esterase